MPTDYLGRKYYHADDLAKMLGVSMKTIYTYIKAGKIKGTKALHKWWIYETDAAEILGKAEVTGGQGHELQGNKGKRRARNSE